MLVNTMLENDKIRFNMSMGEETFSRLFSYEEVNQIINELSFMLYCIDGAYDETKTVDNMYDYDGGY